MNILKLVLTDHWFEEIKSGRKTHEYREFKSFWIKRLQDGNGNWKDYNFVEFQKAYRKNPERITFEIKDIHVIEGKNTDLKIDKRVFDIELGSRIYD